MSSADPKTFVGWSDLGLASSANVRSTEDASMSAQLAKLVRQTDRELA